MLTYGFYNSINNDRKYNAVQFAAIFDGIITDGVFLTVGDALNVEPYSGMRVKVGEGRAWFNRTWTNNDSTMLLTLDPSEIVLNRIDAIVLEVDTSLEVRANTIKIIKGTPLSFPERPELIKGEYLNQYPLAYIYIGQGTTTITAGNITNMIGTDECPWVTGILETVNQNMLDEIAAYLATLTETNREKQLFSYSNGNLSTISYYWEDDTTLKKQEIFYYTNGDLTSVRTDLYDEAGIIQKSNLESYIYSGGNLINVIRTVI